MSGPVWVVLIALGVATLLSILLWWATTASQRRGDDRSFMDDLNSLAGRSGKRVGPSPGTSRRRPIKDRSIKDRQIRHREH